MKFYAALLAVLMVGIAVGQDSVVRFPQGEPGQFLHADNAGVPQWVYKDKFGKLCAVGQILRDKLCYTPKPATTKQAVSLHSITACSGCGTVTDLGPCTADWCDIQVDVPAIQETRTFDMVRGIDLASCANLGGKLEKNSQMCQRQESHWTCREKSRILEHDESTPPKFWCRKPQP